jgi:GDPmannose 4,6-dehydratase
VRAFVTGIRGQDGSYLIEQLLARGYDVHGLVHRGDSAGAEIPAAVMAHQGDLQATEALAGLVSDLEPDEIYNLAGISSVARSWAEPVLTGSVSGLAVASLLEAALQISERTGRSIKFAQASSAEIFGDPEESPQNEKTPVRPITPYGAAKAFGHHLVNVYRSRGLFASSLVLYNHESPRRPETFVTRKITRTVGLIARGEAHELVLGNLDARRDWGWAPDYVDAMVRALQHPTPQDYVVATGVAHSVRDFVAAAFTAAGVQDWEDRIRIDQAFVRPADATEQVGDASRARRDLGWEPTVAFEDIVARMVHADLENAK